LLVSFHEESESGPIINVLGPGIASDGFSSQLQLLSGKVHLIVSGNTLVPGQMVEIRGVEINKTGLVYLKINEDSNIKQCTRNDSDWASCSEPETYYYVIDYSAWSRT
jgi:hypothetical protein